MGTVLLFALFVEKETIEETVLAWDNVNGYHRDEQLDLIDDSFLYQAGLLTAEEATRTIEGKMLL